ncbi:hypothetical protein PPERSA_09187 [Pseudocohnilembus persalinus]|uniref:RING-type E3 ubiquitin transferase n=1 Tax=Pseudocohnilembus persalinus TaxID=266149 RepID=A0A0V0QLT4_PSEPJ|nr:hypothetical protein PPERSA_09187 [Pseudocohnilembus persalinus]|eukprot:KRX03279.1 hypothetical protein PPERSA_09187 [Pseudocohnilembus persalinus]
MAENAKFMEYLVEKQDCPSEFLDPLVCTIMKNPVKLPNSQQIVDKNTIVKHLLEEQNDPFTRSALKIEDVVEMEDLRLEIENFLQKEKTTYIQKKKNESLNKKHQDKKEIFQVDFNAKLEQNEGDI